MDEKGRKESIALQAEVKQVVLCYLPLSHLGISEPNIIDLQVSENKALCLVKTESQFCMKHKVRG